MAKVFRVSRSGFYYRVDNCNKVIQRTESSLIVKFLMIKRNLMVQGAFKKNLHKMVINTM